VCVCRGSLFLDFGCHREYTSCVNLLWPGCVSKSALFLICYKPAAPTAGVPSLIQSAFVEESALIAITLSDGAFSSRPGEGASGCIARDQMRQLFAAKAISGTRRQLMPSLWRLMLFEMV
jgi:hypothetical protein